MENDCTGAIIDQASWAAARTGADRDLATHRRHTQNSRNRLASAEIQLTEAGLNI